MRVLLATLICGLAPALAAAQTGPIALPRHDTTVSMGWAGDEHQIYDRHEWYGSLLLGAAAGRYWTDHLKTEVDASRTNPRRRDVYSSVEQDGAFAYVVSSYGARDVRVGVTQLYQFGRNQWVHPYIGAGIDVVRRETTLERPRRTWTAVIQNRSVQIDIPELRERKVSVFAHGVVKTGLKMYATEKAFFATELKLALRRDVDQVVWKFGVGFDF